MAVVEVVRFRLVSGTDEAVFLRENSRVQREFVAIQPGYVSRQIAKSDDGEWLVLVHWQSAANADETSAAFMREPANQVLVAMIDGATYSAGRYEVK